MSWDYTIVDKIFILVIIFAENSGEIPGTLLNFLD